ncbi:hypothetical protein [Botrimarina sp.]|uniref:ImuA family protein n=1 Tax=Botrimarina sp. TaxID=2795802 RepID=UPI0032EDF2C6
MQAPDPEKLRKLQRLREELGAKGVLHTLSAPPEAPAASWRRLAPGWPGPRLLLDLIEAEPGSGAALIGLWLCRLASGRRGQLVVIDPRGVFYPPCAIAWGADARRLLLVRPGDQHDAIAATECALRSRAVSAVWANVGRLDDRTSRRLVLAAEAGEAVGVLVRSRRHESEPSWADAQWRVEPAPTPPGGVGDLRRVRLVQSHNRHGPAGQTADLQIDWRTGHIDDAPPAPTSDSSEPLPDARPTDPPQPTHRLRVAS